MSSFIFDRMMHHVQHGGACETEEEVEEENYNFNNADVHSKSYLVNLYKNLKNCNYFLNSLIANEQLDYVVISLFKNHQFSFGIKLFESDSVFERVHFTCEDNHIVDYIDNEELPPKLIDVIEMFDFKNIYYNGCIISEIRDYRQSSTDFFNSYFILLKPTSLSLYNDVKKIIGLTNKSYIWTNSARLKLESKLIYLTSPKLCLDPNPCIGILSKKLSRKKLIFGNKLFLRLPRKRLKAIFANDRLKEFKLLNFLKTKKTTSFPKIKVNPSTETSFKTSNKEFKDVQKLAKELHESKDNSSFDLVKVEEYIMEFLDLPGAFTKLTIFKRAFDDIYFGNIVNTRNGDSKGPPNFYLGTKEMKLRYIDQFIETFSENGKKLIKITQKIGNEEPKVKHTQAVEMYLLRQQQQQNSVKLKSEQLKQRQQLVQIKDETSGMVINHNKSSTVNSIINHQNNSENQTSSSNINEIQTNTNATAATTTKIPNNQIVIKHSNFKLINAANFNDKELNDHQTIPPLNHQTIPHHQPVVLNVSTSATHQNGTQIPIRIPLSFSLQQLKSGQIALVPNTATNLTNNNTDHSNHNISVSFNSQNNTTNHTENVLQDNQQQQQQIQILESSNYQHHATNELNNSNNVTYVPTNVNLILQGNTVFTAQSTQQI